MSDDRNELDDGAADGDFILCPICQETKPADAFAVHRKRPNGKQVYCRLCSRGMDMAIRSVEVPTVTEKKCRICGVVKPAEEFPRNKGMVDGLNRNCKVCHKATRRRTLYQPTTEPQECIRCKHTKPTALFSFNKYRSSGLNAVCKDCTRSEWHAKLGKSGVSLKRERPLGPGLDFRVRKGSYGAAAQAGGPPRKRPKPPRAPPKPGRQDELVFWARRLGTVVLTMLLIERGLKNPTSGCRV